MGYIKEPDGVNFVVEPGPYTEADRKIMSEIIAYYKATGKKLTLSKIKARQRKLVRIKKNTSQNSAKSRAK
jgi:hypothetical protein